MKEIYVVTQYDRQVIAMESEKEAAALAERLGGKVEPVQLVEFKEAAADTARADRIERSIERAAKAALEGGAE